MITLCKACGTSYRVDSVPLDNCKICLDERQYIPVKGQEWVEQNHFVATHRNQWTLHQP